jgi:hypothetical protein
MSVRDLKPQGEADPWASMRVSDWVTGDRKTIAEPIVKKEPGLLSDTGNLLKSGVNQVALSLREAVRMIPGVGESIVSGVDSIDQAVSGKTTDELFKADNERIRDSLSTATREALDKKWWDEENGRLGNALTDPRAYFGGLVQSFPGTLLTMVPAARLAKVAYEAKVATMGAKAAAEAAAGTATLAGSIGEGVLGGGGAAASVREELSRLPQETWNASDAYRQLIESGMSDVDAKASLTKDAATKGFLIAGVTTGLFGGQGDKALALAMRGGISGGIAKRVVKGVIGEGVLEEAPQSYAQKVAENIGVQTVDPTRETTAGAFNEALGGLAVGAVQGGAQNALFGRRTANQAQTPEEAATLPVTPVEPPEEFIARPMLALPAPTSPTPDGTLLVNEQGGARPRLYEDQAAAVELQRMQSNIAADERAAAAARDQEAQALGLGEAQRIRDGVVRREAQAIDDAYASLDREKQDQAFEAAVVDTSNQKTTLAEPAIAETTLPDTGSVETPEIRVRNNGTPYATEKSAALAIRNQKIDATPIKIKGGYGIQLKTASVDLSTNARSAGSVERVVTRNQSSEPRRSDFVPDVAAQRSAGVAANVASNLPEGVSGTNATADTQRALTPETVTQLTGEIGWTEYGGRMIRQAGSDGTVNTETISRTKWIPKSDFWPGRPKQGKALSEVEARTALQKAQSGSFMTARERRFVDYAAQYRSGRQSVDSPTVDVNISEAEYDHFRATGEPGFGWMPETVSAAELLDSASDAQLDALLDLPPSTDERAAMKALGFTDEEIATTLGAEPEASAATDPRPEQVAAGTTQVATGQREEGATAEQSEVAESAYNRLRDAELFRKTKRRLIDAFTKNSSESFDELSKILKLKAGDKNDPQSALASEVLNNFEGWRGNYERQQVQDDSTKSRARLDLTGQSNNEILADEARARKAADNKRAQENAPPPEDFALTGSNRAADVGAAAGQNSLFERLDSTLNRVADALNKDSALNKSDNAQDENPTISEFGRIVDSVLKTGGDGRNFYRSTALLDGDSLDRVAKAFGKTVVGYAARPGIDNRAVGIGGASTDQFPDTIFLNANNPRPLFSVLGHELAHNLRRDNPGLYRELVAAIQPYINSRYGEFGEEAVARYLTDKDAIKEEFIGEVLADGFTEQSFWNSVAEKNKNLVVELYDTLKALFVKAKQALQGKRGTEKYLRDFDEVMRIAGEVVGRYANERGDRTETGGTRFATNDVVGNQGGAPADDNIGGGRRFDNTAGNFNPELDKFWIDKARKEINGERMSDAEYNTAIAESANLRRIEELLEVQGWKRRGSSNISRSTYLTKEIGIGEYNAEYGGYDEYKTYEIRVSDHDDFHKPRDSDEIEQRFQISFLSEKSSWADADITPSMSNAEALKWVNGLVPNESPAPNNDGARSSKSIPDTLEIDGKQRPTKNSKGQLIHPTEEGIRNFWAWFGESKVVDDQGRPLVVYHGTGNDFSAFDVNRPAVNNDSLGGSHLTTRSAIFVSPSSLFAGEYGYSSNVKIMPLYVKADYILDAKKGFISEDLIGAGVSRELAESASSLRPASAWQAFDGNSGKELARALSAEYDAVALMEMDRARSDDFETFAVFSPNQIKSATGNSGAFDAANPDIRFAAFDPKQSELLLQYEAAETIESAGGMLKELYRKAANAAKDRQSVLLGLLGRRQILDIYEKDVPELKTYNRILQQMEAEQNEGSQSTDAVIQSWRELPKGVATDTAALMHDATLAGIDPDKSGNDVDLRRRWVRLPDAGKKVYREARDAYKAHFDKVQAALTNRVNRSALSGDMKKKALDDMREKFSKALDGVYFPLARFGDYMVVVRDKSGATAAVSFAESLNEAEQTRADLLRNPDYEGMSISAPMLRKEFNPQRDGVSTGFMKGIVDIINDESDTQIRNQMLDAVNQLYLSSLPDLSWAKSGIHRKGTPGYSKDALRAFARNMFHGGYYLAKLSYGDQLQSSLMKMQDDIDDKVRADPKYDNITAQQVVTEMNKRHKHVLNPDNSPVANKLTGLGFFWFMGLSPASALVNLSQTALVAYPMLGAKFGFAKAANAMAKASQQAAKGRNDLLGQLKGDEANAYRKAAEAGVIDLTMAHDLAGVAQGRSGDFNDALDKTMRLASFMFHHAEKFNRGVTFLAAYRMAREAVQNDAAYETAEKRDAAAYEIAEKAVFESQFDFSANNRPRYFQGPWQRVILLFKQYGQNMIYTLARNALEASRGDKEAMKTLSGMLVMHGLFAGALGLPLVSTLLGAASMIGGSEDEPWDAEVALRNYLAEAFGKDAAEVMMKGMFRAPGIKEAIGADMAGRVGLDSMILRMPQDTLSADKYWEALFMTMGGPVVGIGANVGKGIATMSQGNLARGVEDMMPKALKDPIKAIRYGNEGVVDKSQITLIEDTTLNEEIAQFFGFSPARAMEAYAGKGAIKSQETRLKQRRQELLNRYARARQSGDDLEDVSDMIKRWNAANPSMAITGETLMKSMRNRAKRQAESENGAYVPKRNRSLTDLGEFANSE